MAGNCIFTRIASIVNHSCDPNTTSVTSQGDTQMIIASRFIAKGEEINQIYQGHFGNTSKTDRQKTLREMFHFECQCLACSNDYPLAEHLPKTYSCPESVYQQELDSTQLASIEEDHKKLNDELFDRLDKADLGGIISTYCKRTDLASKSGLKSPHLLYVMGRAALTDCLWLKYGNRGWDFKQSLPYGIYK